MELKRRRQQGSSGVLPENKTSIRLWRIPQFKIKNSTFVVHSCALVVPFGQLWKRFGAVWQHNYTEKPHLKANNTETHLFRQFKDFAGVD